MRSFDLEMENRKIVHIPCNLLEKKILAMVLKAKFKFKALPINIIFAYLFL